MSFVVFAVFRKLGELGKRWNEVLPWILDFFDTLEDSQKSEVVQKIKEFYGIDQDITVKNVSGLTKVDSFIFTKTMFPKTYF